jgi:spermidine synthase
VENEIGSPGLLRVLGFFSGGAVMTVEFTGNRLLAPSFGNSLYTWTALIGVILLALSCGDYLGGWLVDRVPRVSLLPVLFSLGGVLTTAIPLLARLLPEQSTMDLIWGPVVISLALFFLPGLVLASITPVSIRLLSKTLADASIGKSAGTVGMASALGSFAGTIATSYVLLPVFGVRQILFILGGMLLALGLMLGILWRRQLSGKAKLVTLTVAGAVLQWEGALPARADPNVLFERDTFYHRISVSTIQYGNAIGRLLKLDSTEEGAQIVETGDLIFDYQHYWRLAEVFSPHLERALFLGAGAFGMPEKVSGRFPDATVDVVEIDPAVVDVGRRFFRLSEFPKVHAHAVDARRFLSTTPARYDFIFGDAYNGEQYIPAHLVTREFFARVAERLTDRGVYVMNLIGSVNGNRSELFWRIFNSVRYSFPHIQVYASSSDPNAQQNLILVASFADLDAVSAKFQDGDEELSRLLENRLYLPPQPPLKEMFTDDSNPVEYIVAQQLRKQ